MLDTGVLVGLARSAEWALFTQDQFALNDEGTIVSTSVICKGEILALAERRGWGHARRNRLEQVLESFPTLGINQPEIIRCYASISAWTQGSEIEGTVAPPPKPAVTMGQNDIWIAATACATHSLLLTTDKDFSHLNKIWIDHAFVDQTHTSSQR